MTNQSVQLSLRRGMNRAPKFQLLVVALAAPIITAEPSWSDTIQDALSQAFANSPDLNQQRAELRVKDEGVSKAWTTLRPMAVAYANVGPQRTDLLGNVRTPLLNERIYFKSDNSAVPRGVSLNVSQTLFDGGRTFNNVYQAESLAYSSRARLRAAEQNLLQNAATAYMDILRDTAILSLRRSNIEVLEGQLRNTKENYKAGYLTDTDVAQAEGTLSQAQSQYFGSEAQLKTSSANYRRIIGKTPGHLQPAKSVEGHLPRDIKEAISISFEGHPELEAAHHQLDAKQFGVKSAEADLLPTISVQGQLAQEYDFFFSLPGWRQTVAGVSVNLRVPIYQGGGDYASIRIAKEQVGQARFGIDSQREQLRSNVIASYAALSAAKSQMKSDAVTVRAAEVALRGTREEAKVGLRTTADLLSAQQNLLSARVNMIISQHDVVVYSYAALAAIGRLSSSTLNLDAPEFNSADHLNNVRNKWFGTETD